MHIRVTTQEELDDAVSNRSPAFTSIDIESPRNVWLTVHERPAVSVHVFDTSCVRVEGTCVVHAYGSSRVRAYGQSTVFANSTSTVWAYNLSTVHASYRSHVHAQDSSTVVAFDSSTIRAGSHVAVHRFGPGAVVFGGVVIDHVVATNYLTEPHEWAAYCGIEVVDGEAILYKAVDADLYAGIEYQRPIRYPVGSTVTCTDWRDDNECGGGLHISPRPEQALRYRSGADTRFLRVAAKLADLRPIGTDKAKARTVRVLAEVTVFGEDLAGQVS